MELTYQLFTPSERWPQDLGSLAAAISSQGLVAPEVEIQGDTLVIRNRAQDLTSQARLLPYPAEAYESLLAGGEYQPRMLERDRDTPPIQRQVEIQTVAPGPEADQEAVALFHATVTDGIWWLMGGILADPYPAQAYESLLAGGEYQPRMLERDRDTPPIRRQVEIQTVAPGPGADRQAVALFHATVTDGIWWLMGGILADPYRKTVWGWRRWRGDEPLAAHAAETAGHLPAAAEEGQR